MCLTAPNCPFLGAISLDLDKIQVLSLQNFFISIIIQGMVLENLEYENSTFDLFFVYLSENQTDLCATFKSMVNRQHKKTAKKHHKNEYHETRTFIISWSSCSHL